MKRTMMILAMAAMAVPFLLATSVGSVAFAEDEEATPAPPPVTGHGPNFVDLDGDGYNDNAPDHDGDGIPNGQDPDWTRGNANRRCNALHRGFGRGEGRRMGRGMGRGVGGFVDENSDGYNDLAPDHDGDGIPNGQDPDFVRGAGKGRNAGQGPNFVDEDGDGVCDNTGSKSGNSESKGKGKGGSGGKGKNK